MSEFTVSGNPDREVVLVNDIDGGSERSASTRTAKSLPVVRPRSLPKPPNFFSFEGLKIVVAGADRLGEKDSIAGVAGQLVQNLALHGASVLGCGPKGQGFQLAEICNEMKSQHGLPGRCMFMQGDCSTKEFSKEVASKALKDLGGIDALAPIGVLVPPDDGFLHEIDWDESVATYRVNGGIVVHMIQACLPEMRRQQLGRIVLANSRSVNGYQGQTKYAFSKIVDTVKNLMLPYARENVYCNVINLGTTPNTGLSWAGEGGKDQLYPRAREVLGSLRPSGRLFTDSEVAWEFASRLHPRCLLISEELDLDGGERRAGTIFFAEKNFLKAANALSGLLDH